MRVERDDPKGLWIPVQGAEATLLLERKRFSDDDARRVLDEANDILSRCLPPDTRDQTRTGLVIGNVQSGKTLSFTTVTALARDNGYRLVIVLAGTKTNLLDQNEERLTGDLGILEERGRFWRVLVNPRQDTSTVDAVNSALRQWERYGDRPERCRTLLIVVMKNSTRLANLRKLLERCELAGTCALIVDDEGDQAGLNTRVRQSGESPTYARILGLRRAVPAHTYLQYTATPQAPLLISRIDILSPEFVELLEPGPGYVGGKDLFYAASPYFELIPPGDLPPARTPDDGPPESLSRAMTLFFLGVSAGVVGERQGNRSMMIHPSHLTASHDTYAAWARSIKQGWLETLREPPGAPDLLAMQDEFEKAYRDLARTAQDLPPFDELWAELEFALDDTMVRVVNATQGRIPSFPWSDSYGFILVGGAGLDRGFTVEGLTITYMPRGAGTGTADTIQQRARFLGYKGDYKGLVRVFLDADVEHAYTAYVEHEENLRELLKAHAREPLSEWRRMFFLDRSLQPTRRSVMALDGIRGRSKEWVYASLPYDTETDLAGKNRLVVDTFMREGVSQLQRMPGSERWTEQQVPLVAAGLRLADVYERLLVPLVVEDEEDVLDYLTMMMQLREALDDDAEALCDVYLMSQGEVRDRAVTDQGLLENPFQGANPGTGYPGDREVRSEERVSVQVHHVDLRTKDRPPNPVPGGSDLRVVAVAVPRALRKDTMYQPNG